MSDYMPGAVQVPQPGGVTLDTSLPPRFVWHITWDALQPDGSQPDFGAVANYLQGKEWCPHIMWNPFTGYMEQYYPASQGSRALEFNDGDGAACVQVEIFFTPGCVVNGVKYATVADTPLVGWADLLAWADSLGVPRTWPMGAPQWSGNSRDVGIWNGNAGHYGHCNSPGDTHTDPGPMPSLTGDTINPQSTPSQEDPLAVLSDQDKINLFNALSRIDQAFVNPPDSFVKAVAKQVHTYIVPHFDPATGKDDGHGTTLATMVGYSDLQHTATRSTVPPAVLNQQFPLSDGTKTNLPGILDQIHAKPATVTNVAAASIDVEALVTRLKAELPATVLAALATKLAN